MKEQQENLFAPLALRLGKLTPGQLIEMVAELFAALQPLPATPIATRNVQTDVGNLILYAEALEKQRKRNEQILTIARLAAKLVGQGGTSARDPWDEDTRPGGAVTPKSK